MTTHYRLAITVAAAVLSGCAAVPIEAEITVIKYEMLSQQADERVLIEFGEDGYVEQVSVTALGSDSGTTATGIQINNTGDETKLSWIAPRTSLPRELVVKDSSLIRHGGQSEVGEVDLFTEIRDCGFRTYRAASPEQAGVIMGRHEREWRLQYRGSGLTVWFSRDRSGRLNYFNRAYDASSPSFEIEYLSDGVTKLWLPQDVATESFAIRNDISGRAPATPFHVSVANFWIVSGIDSSLAHWVLPWLVQAAEECGR